MFTRIRAIHIAVNSIEEAVKDYERALSLRVTRTEEQPHNGVRIAVLPIGDAAIELIQPLNPEEGPVARSLKNRGEGIYMIALEVDGLDAALKSLQAEEVRLIGDDAESRARGTQPFIHPKSTHGVLIELVEKA
jgi:methylmalonyl-CoA epimerase